MSTVLQGSPAARGIAIGPAWVYRSAEFKLEIRIDCKPEQERTRLDNAIEAARQQLDDLVQRARKRLGEKEAQIFEAHRLILDDPELLHAVHTMLQREKINAEAAFSQCVEKYAQALSDLDSEYFQARAQDVHDVGRRVLNALHGYDPDQVILPQEPVIVVAEDLTPSDTLQFDPAKILGFCTMRGGPTSHTAILARSLDIPAVVGLAKEISSLPLSTMVILDGNKGTLTLDPDEQTLANAQKTRAVQQEIWRQQRDQAMEAARTKDNVQIEVVANVSSVAEAQIAMEFGAEGIGLLRTEFLYIDQDTMPSLEKQIETYKEIALVVGDRPVVVRTLDIGGDKHVPYLGLQQEPNPFLGWRAIRMIDERPEVLQNQFEALLLGFADLDLRVMLPLVSQLDEVIKAREIFETAANNVKQRHDFIHPRLQFGMMVEVPSAALMADAFAANVDFFSIGTNDLVQYTLAVDRTNERVSQLASPFHPAVIKLIVMTVEAAHRKGRWVGLCGEMAGDPLATALLLGMGLDELSMAPASIPEIKQIIRKLSMEECRQIAESVLKLPTTEQVIQSLADTRRAANP